MSASRNCSPWNSPIGLPNCSRSPAYATAWASAAWAMPVATAAMPSRPASSADSATRMPAPSSPISWRGRDPGAVEDHLGGDVAGQAHLLLGRAEAHARGVGRDDERRQAALGVVAGAGEEDVVVGARAVADPLLGAGDDVLVALADRAGADAADVGAGLRLGEAVGAEPVPGEHLRQPLVALLLRCAFVVDARWRSASARWCRRRRSATRWRSPRSPAGRPRRAARRRRTPRRTAGSAAPTCPSSR